MMETTIERISGDLEKYLNEKGSQGWRCISVTTATGLGWTYIVALERAIGNHPVDKAIKIIESKSKKDNKIPNEKVKSDPDPGEPIKEQKVLSALNGKTKNILEMAAKFFVAFEFTWITINFVFPFLFSQLGADDNNMEIHIAPIQWILFFAALLGSLILLFVLDEDNDDDDDDDDEQDKKGEIKNEEIRI